MVGGAGSPRRSVESKAYASIVQVASHRLKSRRRSTTPRAHTGKNDLKRGASDALALASFGRRTFETTSARHARPASHFGSRPFVLAQSEQATLAAKVDAYRDQKSKISAPYCDDFDLRDTAKRPLTAPV